jgi:DnaK suppressor protein
LRYTDNVIKKPRVGEFFNYKYMIKDTKVQKIELDEKTIKEIKDQLLVRKEEISKELEELTGKSGQSVKFPEYGNKSDENAQEISEYTTNLGTEKVLENTLRDIESSLKRMDEGTYGVCKYCKQPIGKKRMLARPVASACIECKTKLQNTF